ncbi:MAG TPA: KamA family radical SAM protein [candidate division Zixibacteria bacterium]|nr:KamA family radical SAM protein [candidate division Zixibacteria bacterium]
MKTEKGLERTYKIIGTEVINEDIFRDRIEATPAQIEKIFETDLPEFWLANPDIYELLKQSEDIEEARKSLYDYLNACEGKVFEIDNDLHILEKANIRESVRVFKSIIAPINEKRTGSSAISYLFMLAHGLPPENITDLSRGFLAEFSHLFRAVIGLTAMYSESGKPEKRSIPRFISHDGREAALLRSSFLDNMAARAEEKMAHYKTGLDAEVIRRREENKNRILDYYGGNASDWQDYKWHLKHIYVGGDALSKLIDLTDDEKRAIHTTEKCRIPFGITPYYISLMDKESGGKYDHAVRAQVIPPTSYVESFAESKQERGMLFDFMGEHDTSPIDLITRRYPEVLIIKPYNSCSQICVYCQRNWEIEKVMDSKAVYPPEMIDKAIDWIKDHPYIRDVLITGGDPFVLTDFSLERIFEKIARIDHVNRIRIGTRMPVVIPFRITDKLCDLMARYVKPGRREVCVVTHYEHPYEVTPESAEAVTKLRRRGISVYNQQVFTFENSRRFETVALRRSLRLIGVDPYYTFITKGKEETDYYRVPLARILQERKEEARLFPGLDRTDEPVFNVPRLGKNHLRSWQDHRLIMILPDGRRVYEFHPWEKFVTPVPPYNYTDVSIYDYLQRLKGIGEDITEYRTIWYYY